MLIMDEVQRLKNWNTQISRAARKIESDYSVILSGTPLENKLDELYSIVEFVDNFRLAPYYIFKENHIITDETGKVLGYKNLNKIGEKLNDILTCGAATTLAQRKEFAERAFAVSSHYDTAIHAYFATK